MQKACTWRRKNVPTFHWPDGFWKLHTTFRRKTPHKWRKKKLIKNMTIEVV